MCTRLSLSEFPQTSLTFCQTATLVQTGNNLSVIPANCQPACRQLVCSSAYVVSSSLQVNMPRHHRLRPLNYTASQSHLWNSQFRLRLSKLFILSHVPALPLRSLDCRSMAEYRVEVTTGNLRKAGTWDHIFVTLIGSEAQSDRTEFNNWGLDFLTGGVSWKHAACFI